MSYKAALYLPKKDKEPFFLKKENVNEKKYFQFIQFIFSVVGFV